MAADRARREVVTFTADLGQGEELEPARARPRCSASRNIYIEDVREEFVRDFVFPMFRANAVYEGVYLLGTSIARPLISKRLVEIAPKPAPTPIAHGATGKGNDQVRFELSAYALNPDIKVIAPWRDWVFQVRTDLINFAERTRSRCQGQARRSPVLGRRQPAALLLRGQGAGRSGCGRGAGICAHAHGFADGSARTRPRSSRSASKRATRSRSMARDEPGDAAGRTQRSTAATTASAGSTWWKTALSA
jgi:hypothetical protein